jgi:hypothetical protein
MENKGFNIPNKKISENSIPLCRSPKKKINMSSPNDSCQPVGLTTEKRQKVSGSSGGKVRKLEENLSADQSLNQIHSIINDEDKGTTNQVESIMDAEADAEKTQNQKKAEPVPAKIKYNILEDTILIKISKLKNLPIEYQAFLLDRPQEGIKKRLDFLTQLDPKEKKRIVTLAKSKLEEADFLRAQKKTTVMDIVDLNTDRKFQLELRLIRFKCLHRLLANFPLTKFVEKDMPFSIFCIENFFFHCKVESSQSLMEFRLVPLDLHFLAMKIQQQWLTSRQRTSEEIEDLVDMVAKSRGLDSDRLLLFIVSDRREFNPKNLELIISSLRQ